MRKLDTATIQRMVFILLVSILALISLTMPSKTAANEGPGPTLPSESSLPPYDTLPPDTTQNAGNLPGGSLDSDVITIIIEAIF